MADWPRIMIYVESPIGMGHFRRCVLLANTLRRHEPRSSVVIITGFQHTHLFNLDPGVDLVKLPSILNPVLGLERKAPTPAISGVDWQLVRDLRARILLDLVDIYAPDILWVEHSPRGFFGDLLDALEFLGGHNRHTRVVIGFQDLLDRPATIRAFWKRKAIYELLDEAYDCILVYGLEEIFDFAQAYGLELFRRTGKLRYTGYLVPTTQPSAAPVLSGRGRGARVLVTVGGGLDGAETVLKCTEALNMARKELPCTSTIVLGPQMPQSDRHRIKRVVGGSRDTLILDEYPALGSRLSEFDLVICMAGYDTMCEILATQTACIVVPREGVEQEQSMRASIFEDLGWVVQFGRGGTPEDLGTLILDTLMHKISAGRSRRVPISVAKGASTAVDIILGLLESAVEV